MKSVYRNHAIVSKGGMECIIVSKMNTLSQRQGARQLVENNNLHICMGLENQHNAEHYLTAFVMPL